jgi:hypothetical protein
MCQRREKIDDRTRFVGRAEIDWQSYAKHQGLSGGDVGIPGKIEVNLQRGGKRCDPRPKATDGAAAVDMLKRWRSKLRKAVGQNHLLEQAGNPNGGSSRSKQRESLKLGAFERGIISS